MNYEDEFVVFSSTAHHKFDKRVLSLINSIGGYRLAFETVRHKRWPDSEITLLFEHPEKIKGKHVIVFGCPTTFKRTEQMLYTMWGCKQYGAKQQICVANFLPGRRQEGWKRKGEFPTLNLSLAKIKLAGADHLVTCEPHSLKATKEYCSEVGLPLHVIDTVSPVVETLSPIVQALGKEKVVFYSPDFGSIARAHRVAKALGDLPIVAAPKLRLSGENVRINSDHISQEEFLERAEREYGVRPMFAPEGIKGKHVMIIEDEVQTGGTAAKTATYVRDNGAASVRFVGIQTVCTAGWKDEIVPLNGELPFDEVFFGNVRPRGYDSEEYEESTNGWVRTIDLAPYVAKKLLKVMNLLTQKDSETVLNKTIRSIK